WHGGVRGRQLEGGRLNRHARLDLPAQIEADDQAGFAALVAAEIERGIEAQWHARAALAQARVARGEQRRTAPVHRWCCMRGRAAAEHDGGDNPGPSET